MAQYIIHSTPYSSPNTRKNIRSNYKVQNLRVFQENPRAGGGVFAQFDLVNPSNPKDKTYHMNFSFADGTSMTANAINRIRRFFNEAYDRQRSSSYGFPELSDTDKTQIVARINTAYNQFAGFSHSDEPDVIDCTSDQDNKPDYLSVKMSAIDDLNANYLEHHGVKGQKWGVINDKPTDPRQRTRSSSGHPYYSPNTGNASNTTNSVVKRDTNPGKNTSTSTKKTYYTADLSQKPLSDKDGVHYVIGIGNSGYGAQITVQSNVITSTLDRKEDLAAMVKNQVIQGIDSFRNNPRYGEPYKNLYLTDKQIDSIVWSLVYKIEKDWKKNYYKPGNY